MQVAATWPIGETIEHTVMVSNGIFAVKVDINKVLHVIEVPCTIWRIDYPEGGEAQITNVKVNETQATSDTLLDLGDEVREACKHAVLDYLCWEVSS